MDQCTPPDACVATELPPPVVIGSATLHHGDCLAVLATMPDASVDAVVTDPPYGLSKEPDIAEVMRHWLAGDHYEHEARGFMNAKWDSFVPNPNIWREVIRVLKPGGHCLCFAGTRTQDLMGISLRFAGFEIRDCIRYEQGREQSVGWVYATGFPKSLNVSKAIDRAPADATDAAKQWSGWGSALKPAWESVLIGVKPLLPEHEAEATCTAIIQLWSRLWLMLPAQFAEQCSTSSPAAYGMDASAFAAWTASDAAQASSALSEGMGMSPYVSAVSGALNTVSSWSATLAEHCSRQSTCTTETACETTIDWRTLKSWISQITPACIIQASIPASASSASASPAVRCFNDAVSKLNVTPAHSMADLATSSDRVDCPVEAEGLPPRPAHVPIILARKPLEGTIVETVLKHGTGALNIDGCRIESDTPRPWREPAVPRAGDGSAVFGSFAKAGSVAVAPTSVGRWPANVVHDGSDQVAAAFASFGKKSSGKPGVRRKPHETHSMLGSCSQTGKVETGYADSGSASRFFYCAKASRAERDGSRHPTVKPVALMAHLCKLVTPPGGTVLDPFAGSGSTGQAAVECGFRPVLIESEAEYFEDCVRRMTRHQTPPNLDAAYQRAPKPQQGPACTPAPARPAKPKAAQAAGKVDESAEKQLGLFG